MKNTKDIEIHRQFWAKVAKDNGWYQEPFYVQIWVNKDGTIADSVAFRTLTQDVIVPNVVYCELCDENEVANPESDICLECAPNESMREGIN